MRRFAVAAMFLLAVFVATACVKAGGHGTPAVRTTLEALANASDVVVVGMVQGEAGTRNLARDPRDPSREDTQTMVLAQDYVIDVAYALKGSVPSSLTVALAKWHGASGVPAGRDADFLPLKSGARYVLFLQHLRGAESSVFAQVPEPFRFVLSEQARVESSWGPARDAFPARATTQFLADVKAAIGNP